jgi:Peptidase inhibitor I78 family
MNCRCPLTLLALVLAEPGLVKAQPAQPTSPTARCKEENARFAVEELYSDELAERARRAAGANVVRKTGPGRDETMDLRADRLNLDVDSNSRIRAARCG